jgi:HD-GYP domain-containing protein (c-di-GMP phosphodiesterase class II)
MISDSSSNSDSIAPELKWRQPTASPSTLRQLCEVFGRAADARDGRREGHARDAAFYAGLIAREMELTPREVEHIEWAALLHGIGKIAVPDTILQKPTPLTHAELERVREAAVEGAAWLDEIEDLKPVALLVRHQNERWDGAGYPDALSGEFIPLGARVIATALRFAALTRPRADRPAMSVVSGAVEFVAYEAGGALDPSVVRAFLGALGREYLPDRYEESHPENHEASDDTTASAL